MVTTPSPSSTSTSDAISNESEYTPSKVASKPTPRKRKAVSFADYPTNIDDVKTDDVIITSSETMLPPKDPDSVKEQSSADVEVTFASPAAKDTAANLTPTKMAERSRAVETPSPLSAIRDVLSDEESVASSVSSFASDNSSVSERSTRRRRGRGRRGRGKRILTPEENKEGSPSGRGTKRGRGRRRGRGGRSAQVEITRLATVEVGDEAMKAGIVAVQTRITSFCSFLCLDNSLSICRI